MKKVLSRLIISFLLIALSIMLLGSCGQNSRKAFSGSGGGNRSGDSGKSEARVEKTVVGKWKCETENDGGYKVFYDEIEFFSDGTQVTESPSWSGSYSINDNRLSINGRLYSEVFTFEISDDGKTLTIVDESGNSKEYKREGDATGNDGAENSGILVGKWKCEEEYEGEYEVFYDTIEFFSDGTQVNESASWSGTYSVEGNRLSINGRLYDEVFTFEVSDNGNKLTLINKSRSFKVYDKKN